jgi:hypothetical protein
MSAVGVDGRSVSRALAGRVAAARLDWIVPAWPVPANVGALSTTRSGGVSTGAAATMDLGLSAGTRGPDDTPGSLAHNRRRLDAFLPSSPVWLRQVHGTEVVVLDAATVAAARAAPPVADAAATRECGVVCAALTADCLPAVFADRAGTAVGVAHAGWRGLAAGVLEATVAALGTLGARAGDLVVWLGPAIGPSAFEVGADVHDAFTAGDPDARQCFAPLREGKWLADLPALARLRLARAGVTSVHGGGTCTHSDATRFYSHRRDRVTGRMATLVWLAPDAEPAKI